MSDKSEELKRKIADLEARLPKHSVKPNMIAELEELEEELEKALAEESAARKDQ